MNNSNIEDLRTLDDIKLQLKTDKQILVTELERYGSNESKTKKMRSCCNCESSDALSIKENKDRTFMYHCFSCDTGGDVIKLVQDKENTTYIKALKLLCKRYNIDFDFKSIKINRNKLNKDNLIDFYENKYNKEMKKLEEGIGSYDEAYKARMKASNARQENNYFDFPYVDYEKKPLKIWENVQALLEGNNIDAVYNIIQKEINILNINSDDFNSQILDVHSLCTKTGLKVSVDFIVKAINRIAMQNKYNPVQEYLEECADNWDGKEGRIQEVSDCLKAINFDENLKYTLLEKWLLNTVNIVYNVGASTTEGCLVLQGAQGCGKTSFIKTIVPPQFLKTGLDLNPSDTDSIRKCIKYWVVELGELDATMKSDQAKLKAFITESVDEYRIPYAVSPMRYNRTTSFFGTVNKSNFLKDETGDRRYWVIPVKEVDLPRLQQVDINQLWGEVMNLLPLKLNELNLNKEELKRLEASNEEFRVKGDTQIKVETSFTWGQDPADWVFMPTSEIANSLGLKTTSGLKEALEKCGAKYKRTKTKRGYLVPSFMNYKSQV